MKKFSSLLLFAILFSKLVMFAANPSITITPLSPTVICASGADTLLYSVNATGIPANTNVVIYQSTDSSFNPNIGQGDSIGFIVGDTTSTSVITSVCPKILGIFIDACNDSGRLEPANEYMVITSGQGFRAANLKIDFPNTNLRDINTGSNPCSFGTPSNTLMTLLRTGFCNSSNLIAASQADSIPPNALVIVFTGAGTDYPYNLSRFCQTGQKVYILQNACVNGSGAFVNNDAAGTTCFGAAAGTRYRTTTLANRNCFDELTYDRCGLNEFDGANPNANDGNYVVRLQNTDTSSVANGGIQNNIADRCNGVVLDSITKSKTLKFAIPNAFCNTGFYYIKAVLKPSTASPVLSNTIAYKYVCNDVRAISSTTSICSGENAIINISSTDPNASFSWTVSGGSNITGESAGTGNQINQTLSYAGLTSDNVTYNITSNDAGCTKTTSINVVVRNCASVVDTVTICRGDSVQICGPTGFNQYTWSPSTGLSTTTDRCTFAKPTTTTQYNVIAFNSLTTVDTIELIRNGAFEDSMNFWNTDLFLLTPQCGGCNGWFYIGNTTYYCNNPDHTASGVKLFNSSPTADTSLRVLYQTVSVQPNTNYKFSAWAYAHNSNNAIFNVKINNDIVVSSFELSPTGCVGWENFTGTWNSGNSTTANIVIKDYRQEIVGNDFSIDDISLRKLLPTAQVLDSVVVIVKNCDTCNLSPVISGNTSICNQSPTTLTVSGQYDSIRWNTGATTASITVSQSANYSVTVYQAACFASTSVNVTSTNVAVSITGDAVICGGTFVTLTASGNAQFDSIRWNTGANTNTINVTQQGIYSVTAYINGCSATTSFNVARVSIDYFLDKKIDTICSGDTAKFVLSAGDLGATAVDTFYFTQAGKYLISYQTPNCGLFNDSVIVVAENAPRPFSLGNDTAFCGDFSKILSTGNQNTVWNTGVTASQIVATQEGQYIATISNACGAVSDTIFIAKNALPIVDLGNDTAFCDGEIILTVNAGQDVRSILWSNGNQTSSITVSTIGTYSVVVTNTNACSDSDAITLSSNCANEIWLPNAFTPDGNGINDVFYVRGNPGNTIIEKFAIYNRWGNKVFEVNDVLPDDKTKGWNGSYKSQLEQLEVYGYEVIAKFANGEKRTLKGNVTLIR